MANRLGKSNAVRTYQRRQSFVATATTFFKLTIPAVLDQEGKRWVSPPVTYVEAVLTGNPPEDGYYPACSVVLPWDGQPPNFVPTIAPDRRPALKPIAVDAIPTAVAAALLDRLELCTRP